MAFAFCGQFFSQRFILGQPLNQIQTKLLSKDIKTWRARLSDISWYMGIVNETIARKANNEDQCTGRLWEGRFNSQAHLDSRALLACMAYVDLNPVRASIASLPATPKHTCVKQRTDFLVKKLPEKRTIESVIGINQEKIGIDQEKIGIPFKLVDYLELVDWTGRILRGDKRGRSENVLPPILKRLSLGSEP
ncbi:MAG: hypothetical protein ACI854_002798 [Arenicella sp.]